MSRNETVSQTALSLDAPATHSPAIWSIALPEQVRANDSRLHATARQLLQMPNVRSVTIDGERQQATVRLRSRRSADTRPMEIPPIDFRETSHDESADSAGDCVVTWVDARDQSWSFIALPPKARGVRRALLLAMAGLSLALGVLGIALPGLPTTPFVLVASYCLLRSSPRLHARMLESKLFGGVLRDWYLHRGVRPHVRYKATAVVVLVLAASLVFTSLPLAAKLSILAVGAIGVTYVWRLPSIVE